MPDPTVDPRHSPAFQRGFDGSASARLPPFYREDHRPPPARAEDPIPPEWVKGPGDAEDETTEADEAALLEAERRDVAARRHFRIWTIGLIAVGIGLLGLSYVFSAESWGAQYYGYSAEADGTFTMETPEGRIQLDGPTFMFLQYRSQMSSWIALVGIGTIVAALFRAAGRR